MHFIQLIKACKLAASYHKMGMNLITDAADSFAAAREGFWSKRFTKEQIFRFIGFIPGQKFICTALDTYEYAMQVRIRK